MIHFPALEETHESVGKYLSNTNTFLCLIIAFFLIQFEFTLQRFNCSTIFRHAPIIRDVNY